MLCLLLVSVFGAAQTPDTATVRGHVFDPSQAALPGVRVTLTNQATSVVRATISDNTGSFSIAGLPVTGEYTIRIEKQGFAPAERNDLDLIGGSAANFTFQLRPAGQTTEVTVTGVSGEVRTDAPQIGIYLDERQIQQTPLPNRRITFLPLLNSSNRPTISTGDAFVNQDLFTTNGAGRRQANFVVDGSAGIDLWGRQTVMTNLPVESVQEMSVLTNAFTAEYGAGVGSVVNIVTKTGGNGYHGFLLGNLRPAALSAQLSRGLNAVSGTQVRSDYVKQISAGFGGPIGSGDKTHFYAQGEYTWQNRTSPMNTSAAAFAPNGFVGHYRGWLGFARVDHKINDSNNLFLKLSADSFRDTNPGGAVGGGTLPTAGRAFTRRTYTTEIGETAVISPTLINNFRASLALALPITAFDPFILSTQVQVPISNATTAGTFTSGTSQAAKLQNRQFEFTDTLSMSHSRHSFKFGGSFARAHTGGNSKEFGGPSYLGTLTYKQCTLSTAACETTYLSDINNVQTYSQSFGNAVYTIDDNLWSLFVQDDIRATRNLTLNAGLRYERQTFTDSAKNFAPRVGFAYNLFGDGKTAIRGGYGIYYSTIPDNNAANYALSGPTGVFTFSANPGQPGFPTSVASVPYATVPTGFNVPVRSLYLRPGRAAEYASYIDTTLLHGYQAGLWSPYSQQWSIGIERELAPSWILSLDYLGSRTIKINRPLDVNPPSSFVRTTQGQTRTANAANCTRPTWIAWYTQHGTTCPATPQPAYGLIQSDVNNGYSNYNALTVNLNHRLSRRSEMLVSYTWSHALDNVDPDIPQQNPNDPLLTGRQEYADAIFDQRQRLVISGIYNAPFKFNVGGITTVGTGFPYNITTGTNNSGNTGGTTDRPVINGAVIGRNAGRGGIIIEVSPFVERPISFTEHWRLNLRAEAFNLTNHSNFVGYNSVYGNTATPPAVFGTPGTGITSQFPARSFQFSARLSF